MTLDRMWLAHRCTRPATEYAELVRRGAPQAAVEAGGVAVADIVVSGERFDFPIEDERTTRGLIFAVRGDDNTPDPWIAADVVNAALHGTLLDLVAELPNGRIVSHLGRVDVLGVVAPQMMSPQPTRIWRSPSRWLRAGCEGLVLIDPRQHVRQRVLRAIGGPIVAEDVAHAAELRTLLAAPTERLPRVVVAEVRNRRAA